MAKLMIIMMCLLTGYCQDQQSRITLHMDSSIPDPIGGAKDITFNNDIQKTVDSIFCHGSPGVSFNVRLDPNTGNMEIVEDILNPGNVTTHGVRSCMPSDEAEQCSSTHVCTPGSTCSVDLTIDCDQTQGPTKWERIPEIEVTFANVHGELVLQNCYVMCQGSGFTDEGSDQGREGLSYLAIGLIIAGTILAGFLLVLGFVVWKIRDMKRVEHPELNIHHQIHYVTR